MCFFGPANPALEGIPFFCGARFKILNKCDVYELLK